MTRLTVQAAFGYPGTASFVTWTDITSWVDIQSGVRITRGASDELSDIQPGTLSMTLDNSDGRFTPGRTSSPYYPFVRKNTPIRALITTTAGKNLVTNPGFEGSSSADWDLGTPPALTKFADATHAHSGTYGLRIAWDNAGTGGVVQTNLYGLTVGQVHTASAWVWVPAGDAPVRLNIQGGPVGAPSSVTGAFQQISVVFTATAAWHVLQITTTLSPPALGDLVWVDDVQVEEGAAATSFDGSPAMVHARFYGLINGLPMGWKGLQSSVPITATDLFKWLSKRPALRPFLVEEILYRSPAVYYPLSEPADSTSAGDLSGTTAGALQQLQVGAGGTLQFAEGTGPPSDGLGCPLFTPASISAGLYLTADMGQAFYDLVSTNYLWGEVWFSTTTNGRVIFAATSPTGGNQLVFSLETGTGLLKIEGTNSGGSLIPTVVATGNLADGANHHIVYDEFNQNVYVDGTGYAVTVPVMAGLRTLTVGGYANTRLWQGTISHLALYAPPPATMAPGYLTDHYVAGTTGYAGETADVRVARLARYAGVNGLITVGTFSPVASQANGGKSSLDHMREVETTEAGKLMCDRGGASLLLQSRTVRYNPATAATFAYADTETDGIVFTDDDQKLQNTIIASRPGGATQRVIAQESIDAYGPYEQPPLSLLKMTDLQVLDAAYWIVLRYADPLPEMRQLTIEGYSLGLTAYRALLDADVSTVLAVTSLPAEAQASSASVSVEGYTETIAYRHHAWDFHVSRATTDAVWVLDDPTYSVLGTSTRLAY